MLDHIGVAVSDVAKSKAFFQAALAPLGYKVVMDFGEAAGLGADGRPDFWIAAGKPGAGGHIAFAASNRATVKAFYDAAIAAGARDNGAPGLRPQYHPNYYGAFVIDRDGNNIEAVCHQPE
ncbi:MAG TPA: VOC family protein [Candidatus Binataceae bacterium]|nr:VOC family protein [Candidatus Binataceae bacterium]